MARERTAPHARRVALLASAASALLGALSAWTAPYVIRKVQTTTLEVGSRLLGLLLAAVGVELFLTGLERAINARGHNQN